MAPQKETTIAIIGLGVIGGSLGLAFEEARVRATVVGYDTVPAMRRALKRNAIDRMAGSLKDAAVGADIVFVCTPVSSILRLLPAIAQNIGIHTIVTDVGSVKGVVHTQAGKYFRAKGIFVGGHPMAGSEGSGIEFADPLLFQNAVYVLCPLKRNLKDVEPLSTLLKKIGARVMLMTARDHDRVAAAISHLPQLAAVGLMNLAADKNEQNRATIRLAAGGFRDMTRIASSPFPIWKDILSYNSVEVRKVLAELGATIKRYQKEVSGRSLREMQKNFQRAKAFRDAIPRNSKGFLHPTYDIYLWADDKPGVLAKITRALFDKRINISDIELMKIREGQGGTFRLSFETHEASQKAIAILRRKKFRVQ